ncbi:MAG: DUF4234 domain-containing protein [Candidatus Pacearchaeota archaeon]|jgi:NADH:ubiquinone oxidoreductase subunit 5 (subunit L)/multisubunit Na+/H+ antiporter MnhA subunit
MEVQEKVPQKKNVIILLILSLITLGIYPCIWYFKKSSELNNLKTQAKLGKFLPIATLLLLISLLTLNISTGIIIISNPDKYPTSVSSLSEIPSELLILGSIALVLGLLIIIFGIVLSFKVRKILNQVLINKDEKVKLSGFYTLIFNLFYLQYEINRIIDDKENDKRKAPLICLIITGFTLAIATTIFLLLVPIEIILSRLR